MSICATYTYRNAENEPVYEVIRREPKSFTQRQVDGHGGHTNNMDGVERIPYRLPQLLELKSKGNTVIVVEGEKDADNLARLGFCATTNAGGATWRFSREFVEHFRDAKRVVVIPDCDEGDHEKGTAKGREAAKFRAHMLATVCDDVRIVDLAPDRHDGYDVSDWIAEGHTKNELRALIESAPPLPVISPLALSSVKARIASSDDRYTGMRLVTKRLSEIEAEPISWLWQGRIPRNEPVIIGGPPGVGKSYVVGGLIAAITTGTPPPGGGDLDTPGDVLVLALEDDAGRVLRSRYEAMGADLSRVHIIQGVLEPDERVAPFTLGHIEALEHALDNLPEVVAISIDPISGMMGGSDTHRSNEVRERLDPFLETMKRRGITTIFVTHTNKSIALAGASRIEGSIGGFVGRARAVLAVGLDPGTGIHGVGLLKSNYGRTDIPVIGFGIDDAGKFEWLPDALAISASELFEQGQSYEQRSETDEARESINAALASGEMSAGEFRKSVLKDGVTDITFRRTRALMKREGAISRLGGGKHGPIRWSLGNAENFSSGSSSLVRLMNNDEPENESMRRRSEATADAFSSLAHPSLVSLINKHEPENPLMSRRTESVHIEPSRESRGVSASEWRV